MSFLKRKADANGGRTSTTSYAAKVFVDTSLKVKRDFMNFVGFNRVAPATFSSKPEAAKRLINGFVAKSTRGLIPTIIEDSGAIASASMAIVSAIYFEGMWVNSFHEDYTHKAEFTASDGKSRTINFMTTPAELKLNHRNHYDLDSQVSDDMPH